MLFFFFLVLYCPDKLSSFLEVMLLTPNYVFQCNSPWPELVWEFLLERTAGCAGENCRMYCRAWMSSRGCVTDRGGPGVLTVSTVLCVVWRLWFVVGVIVAASVRKMVDCAGRPKANCTVPSSWVWVKQTSLGLALSVCIFLKIYTTDNIEYFLKKTKHSKQWRCKLISNKICFYYEIA